MLPPPQELGLPSKYVTWRKNQEKAILDGVECARRAAVQVQRAGKGKTVTYMTQRLLLKDSRFVILTPNIGLQDQLIDEWGEYGVADIRGKSRYECDGIPGKTCEDGQLSKCIYKGTSMCGWGGANVEAKQTSTLVTNYSCWTAANRYGQGFGPFDVMILDEAHVAPKAVAAAMRVTFSDREMDWLKYPFPDDHDYDVAKWKQWALIGSKIALNERDKLKEHLDKLTAPRGQIVQDYKYACNVLRKLAEIGTCNPKKWVCDSTMYGYSFDIIDPGAHVEATLFKETEKLILVSGTIRPKTCEKLNMDPSTYEFFEYEDEINVSKSPFIQLQTGIKLNKASKAWEIRELVKWLDRIIEKRLDRKGIVHTASFPIQQAILTYSRFAHLMVANRKGDGVPTSEIIAMYKSRPAPCILVSPSVTTGYDFPYDACRWQALFKAPWANIATKLAKARMEDDKYDAAYDMMQAIAQAFGRGDRADDDWQEFFALDENIYEGIKRYHMFGPSWLPAYVRIMADIQAPPPLGLAA